jgi:hypothetical protein
MVLAKMQSDEASPYFQPFLIGNMSNKYLPTRALVKDSFEHAFIRFTSFVGIPNSMRTLYKTALNSEHSGSL